MILEESTWVEAGEAFRKTKLAIVPIGATECHGPHNPLGMETLIVEELARRLDKRVDAIITPTIPVSYSRAWNQFPGTLWVSPGTLKAYLTEICSCLADNGVRQIFFINGHGPNISVVEEINQDLAFKGIQCAQIDLWRFIGSVSEDLGETARPLGHSGELPTSLMMVLNKSLIRMDELRPETPKETLSTSFPDVIQYYPISATMPSAYEGDPTKATEEKGEIILEICLNRLEKFLELWVAQDTVTIGKNPCA